MRLLGFSSAECDQWSHMVALFFSATVIQNVNKAQVKVRAKKDNVAGDALTHYPHAAYSLRIVALAS